MKLLPLTDIVLSEDDIDIAWTKWSNTFLAVVNTFIPRKQTSRSYIPPYFTSEIVHLLHQKETTRKRAKKSDSIAIWEKFRDLPRRAKTLIKSWKRDYIKSLAESLPTNLKKFWNFFKYKSSKSSLPDTMTLSDSSFTTSTAKPILCLRVSFQFQQSMLSSFYYSWQFNYVHPSFHWRSPQSIICVVCMESYGSRWDIRKVAKRVCWSYCSISNWIVQQVVNLREGSYRMETCKYCSCSQNKRNSRHWQLPSDILTTHCVKGP